MTNNNYKSNPSRSCAFGETLVAVLYGEATPIETHEFAAHAAACALCREELTAFGEIKTSLAFWRETDFDNLAAPAVEISSSRQQNKIVPAILTASWLDRLRALFAPTNFGWQTAAAFSLLAVFAAFAFVFVSQNGRSPQVAVNRASVTETPARQAPTPVTILAPENASPSVAPNQKDAPLVAGNQEPKRKNQVSENEKPAVKKVVKAPVAVETPPRPRVKETRQKVPNQNQMADFDEFADESDDGLRLVDLLEEIEPSE